MKAISSLRSLLVYLVLAAIAPLLVFSLVRSVANSDRDLAAARQNLEFTATAVAQTQERVADAARQLLVSIASVPKLLDRDGSECADYFKTLGAVLPAYSNVGLISVNGRIVCHTTLAAVGGYAGDRDYFQAALARDGFVASGYLLGRVTNSPLIAFALPMKDAQGRVTAVAFVALYIRELGKAVSDVKLLPDRHLLIMDRAGIVLAENMEPSTAIGKPVANPLLLQAIQSGARGLLEGPDANGKQKMYVLTQTTPASDSAFFVAVGLDRDAVMVSVRQQLLLSLVVLLLVTSLGCVLAWVVGGRAIMKPALQVLEATQGIQAGRLDARIPLTSGDATNELTQIAYGFNQMAETLQQREADLMLELQRTEQAWETLDTVINSLKDGLVAVDSDARIVLANEPASKIFPFVPDITLLSDQWPEAMGLFVPGTETLYDLEDLPLYKALRGQSGEAQRILVKNNLVSQGQLISVNYRPVKDSQGRMGGLMAFTDITELDKLQQEQTKNDAALRESQRQLLDAQRLGRMGHWQMNPDTRAISWSDELYELFGLPLGTFDGRQETFLQWVHPADRARYAAQRDEAMQDKKELNIEYRIVTPAGQIRWMHQIGQTHWGKDGQASYRAGVVQEITTRKESELALARSTDLLQRTGEMALIGGWEITFDPLTTHWSDEIFRIHECDPGDGMSSRRAIRFFAPEAQPVLRKALRAAMEHGTPWDLELPLITAKGRRIWVRTQGEQAYVRGRPVGLSGALQDVTSQHHALEQLRLLENCVSRLNDIVLITEAEPIHDAGPRIVFVNDAFERRTGYTREEVMGKTPRLLQGPKTDRAELDRIGAALKKWQPVRAELINYTKAGKEFWIELDIVPIANAHGGFTHWVAVERDITKRKLAEQAMRESEQRYAALFEEAPVPMWVFDAETFRFLTVNNAAVSSYGYSVAEFLSMTIFDIRSEAEAKRLQNYHERQSMDSSQRWEHRRKDGSVFTVRGVAQPVQYVGRPARFALAVDVSAQVQAEADVRDYLATLQLAALANQKIVAHQSVDRLMDEVAMQARCVIGAHHAAVSLCVDDAWANATHVYSMSDKYKGQWVDDSLEAQEPHKMLSMIGGDIYATISEKDHGMRMTQAELESNGTLYLRDFSKEQHVMCGWLAIPLIDRSGKKMGLLQLADKFKGDFTLQDQYVATELAQLAAIAIENALLLEEVNQLNTGLEQKVADRTADLARQEALFRALAEQAPQVIWTADNKGHISYGNRAWFDLMGGRLEDWLGLKWMTAIHAEDLPQVKANWARSVANQTPFSGVRRLLAKDGSYHVMSYRAQPVLDADGKVDFWVGIDADVTEIKAIESALRLSNQELEAFSYSVSHDLRSPLNTIDGFSRLLSKQLGQNVGDKERHYLSRIQAGAAQMGKLIEDLLSLAQVSRVQLQHEAVDLTAICQGIVDDLQTRQPDRKADVQIENGLHAHGDAGLIRIALENLLGNAWKFSSQVAQASIRVGQKTDAAGEPVFFVSDNGAGFDMTYADKLFVAFQRLHPNSEFPGTGIGLATVSRAIARHDGQLWAEAAVGKGATFFFTLPR